MICDQIGNTYSSGALICIQFPQRIANSKWVCVLSQPDVNRSPVPYRLLLRKMLVSVRELSDDWKQSATS